MRTLLSVVGVVILASSAVLPAFTEELREEFHQTYPLAADGSFGLANINGDVRIVGWDRNEVKIDAVKTASSNERLDELKIEVEATPNKVYVRTKYPETQGRSKEGRNERTAVEYTVSIPKSAKVDKVELVNGNLTVESVNGDMNAATVNGRITASKPGGNVEFSTVNGRIEATLGKAEPSKSVELKTVNGEIGLALPADSAARVKAITVHGNITNDFGLTVVKGRFLGSSLEGQIGSDGANVRIKTVNGGISISKAGEV